MTDFKEVINSIVYAVLLGVEYKQRTEDENEEFYFESWAEDVALQEYLCSVVDSYACTRLKTALAYILDSEQDIKNVDPGLYADCGGSWEDMTKALTYELLRMTAYEEVHSIVENNLPMLEAGGVVPESNDHQLWFGNKEPPTFRCLEKLEESKHVRIAQRGKTGMSIFSTSSLFGSSSLVFEGRGFTGTAQDLVELTFGGPFCVQPRRVYVSHGVKKDLKVGSMLRSLIQKGYLEVTEYGETKNRELLLSHLR